MNIINKHKVGFSVLASVLAIFAVIFFTSTGTAHANPSSVSATVQTATATTSPAYMTPGTATSTLTFDAYANTGYGGLNTIADKAALLMQFTGSSTSAVLGIKYEYSQDGIDWYTNFMLGPAGLSTTTAVTNLATPTSITWTYSAATPKAIITVPTPTRYVRAVFSITGANGSIWAQVAPVKELK